VARGTLIAESLRAGGAGVAASLHVHRVFRVDAGDVAAGQPRRWTFIEFEVDDAAAGDLAERLAAALDPDGGWYCDFRTATETFVVFAGAVLRYPRGDAEGRAAAADHARRRGVPEAQIDWPE
jgi:hypothetical protein